MDPDLKKRLTMVEGEGTTHWYRNPDGPEAVAEIQRLEEEVDGYYIKLKFLSKDTKKELLDDLRKHTEDWFRDKEDV